MIVSGVGPQLQPFEPLHRTTAAGPCRRMEAPPPTSFIYMQRVAQHAQGCVRFLTPPAWKCVNPPTQSSGIRISYAMENDRFSWVTHMRTRMDSISILFSVSGCKALNCFGICHERVRLALANGFEFESTLGHRAPALAIESTRIERELDWGDL